MGGKITSARITVYLPPEKADELSEWATSEHRSVSNLVAAVLLEVLEGRKPSKYNKDDKDNDKGASRKNQNNRARVKSAAATKKEEREYDEDDYNYYDEEEVIELTAAEKEERDKLKRRLFTATTEEEKEEIFQEWRTLHE